MSSKTQAKFPAFHSAEKIKECGLTPGNPRSADKLYLHMVVFQKEDIRVKQGISGIIHSRLDTSVEYFSRAHLCCVRFFVEEI